jgi:hypothetical protein
MSQTNTETDLPLAIPAPPEKAGRWAADRLGESGWENLAEPAGTTGGKPKRWLELPCDIPTRWGAGVYRLHWQTTAKRPLGMSEPFRIAGNGQTPQPVAFEQAPPAPAPAPAPAPPAPAPAPPLAKAKPDRVIAELEQQLRLAQAAALPPEARVILAMEERANIRHEAALRHHLAIADSQTRAFELYLGRVDERDKLHQAELSKLRDDARAQIAEVVQAAHHRESELAQELAKTRDELGEQGEQLAELLNAPATDDPEGIAHKINAAIQALETPQAQRLLSLILGAFSQRDGASPEIPSIGPAENGDSVGKL